MTSFSDGSKSDTEGSGDLWRAGGSAGAPASLRSSRPGRTRLLRHPRTHPDPSFSRAISFYFDLIIDFSFAAINMILPLIIAVLKITILNINGWGGVGRAQGRVAGAHQEGLQEAQREASPGQEPRWPRPVRGAQQWFPSLHRT